MTATPHLDDVRMDTVQVEDVHLDVRLRRRVVPVLRGVSLRAAAGQRVALSGRSGSGKSSLCTLLAGLRRPTRGTIRIGGVEADRVDDWSAVSYLPQHATLEPVLTVAENIAVSRLRTGDDADELVELLGLRELTERLATELSVGERQRVALARTLLGGRRVVVLDEPTSAQDAGHLVAVLDAIESAAADGSCVVVATHDARVLDRCDVVVELVDGRVR